MRFRGEYRMRCWSSSSSEPWRKIPYGVPARRWIHAAGNPAGLRLPHHTNPGSKSRARARACRDQTSRPCTVRSRRLSMDARCTRLVIAASTAALPGQRPVETTSDPGG